MKNSDFKKFGIDTIVRFKFEKNIHPEYFTLEDSNIYHQVYDQPKKVRDENILRDYIFELNCEMMNKLKNFMQGPYQNQEQTTTYSKMKALRDNNQQQPPLNDCQRLPELQDKRNHRKYTQGQNINIQNQKFLNGQGNKNSKQCRKILIKRLPTVSDLQNSVIQDSMKMTNSNLSNSYSSQQIGFNNSMRDRKQIEQLKQKESKLRQQNKNLREMLKKLEQSKRNKEQGLGDIDFNIVLKLKLEQEIMDNNSVIEMQIKKEGKKVENNSYEKNDKMKYLEDLVSHLQIIVSAQNQELQKMRQKLIEAQNNKRNIKGY